MKSKLYLQSLAAIFFLTISLGAAPTQKGPGAPPAVDPNTGLPITMPLPGNAGGLAAPQPRPAPQWMDPKWKDPDIVLTNVSYETPLGEVTEDLRARFRGFFDVLTPVNPVPDLNWQSTMIRLQLKNVTASEVFNAMNLVFENDQTPLHWELKINGKRPTALLRVLAQPGPNIDPTTGLPMPPPETKRGVYFVGNLLGDEKTGGMTMEQLVQTLSEVHQMSFSSESGLQFHKQAQLVIVTGTDAGIEFIGNTLTALRQKEELDAAVVGMADLPEHPDAVKPDSVLEESLDTALQAMDAEERQLIEWFYFDRLSHQEIAGQLNATPKAVSSRLERARVKLRSLITRRLSHEP